MANLGFATGVPAVRADDPKPPAPAPVVAPVAAVVGPAAEAVTPGNTVYLDASGSVTDYPIEWSVSPPAPLIKLDLDGRKRVYGLLPNLARDTDYLVTVVALGKDGQGNPTGAAQTVKFSTKAALPVVPVVPTPTPAPQPGPTPPAPAPVTPIGAAPKWAVLVWDFDNDEPPTAALRGGQTAAKLLPLGCTWGVETTAQAAANNRAGQLAGEAVPVVLFLDAGGRKVGSLRVAGPSGDGLMQGTTPDDVVAKAQAIKGGR